MASQQHLWVFEDFEKNMTLPLGKTGGPGAGLPSVGPAPMLRPATSNDDIFETISKGGIDKRSYTVNVVKDFPWSNSPQNNESIQDVPEIHMREMSVEFNPFINQLLANLSVINNDTTRGIKGGLHVIDELFSSFKSKEKVCQGNPGDSAKNNPQVADSRNWVGQTLDFLQNTNKALSKTRLKRFKTKIPINDPDYDPMAPYERLYETSPTGWKYKFPFFDDKYRSLNNSWGAANRQGPLAAMGDLILPTAQNVANTLNVFEPGVYIEEPSSFAFTGRERSVTLSFPLINTRTYDEVMRNWQLIFLLTYQNLPNRVSRSIILPPVIYESLVPGVWYSKYSYISNLSIDFIGARRKMDLRLPTITKNVLKDFLIGQTDISTIIPDAYNVTMQIQELFPESQNHMYTALKKRYLNNKIRTGEMDSNGSILGATFGSGLDLINNVATAIGGPDIGNSIKKGIGAYEKGKDFLENVDEYKDKAKEIWDKIT
jgi:hypothetical protein